MNYSEIKSSCPTHLLFIAFVSSVLEQLSYIEHGSLQFLQYNYGTIEALKIEAEITFQEGLN